MSVMTRIVSSLFAVAAAVVVLPAVAISGEHDRDLGGKRYSLSGERDISHLEFPVNIVQKTGLDVRDAKRVLRDKEYIDFFANLHVLDGEPIGFITVQRSPTYGFDFDNRSPARSNKALKRAVRETFSNDDLEVERIEKFRSKRGFGRIAFFEVEDTLCVHGAVGYNFENIDLGGYEQIFDTYVAIVLCDPFGRAEQVVDFLTDVKLVTVSDNRAAYAARRSLGLVPVTVSSHDSGDLLSARLTSVRDLLEKGLITEEEAGEKIKKLLAE